MRPLIAWLVRWWLAHLGDVDRREAWGYGVWLGMGAVLAVPELWAAVGDNVPWPTISATVGHLEYEWSPTGIFVVGLMVFAAFHAVRYPVAQTGRRADAGPGLARTEDGRLTRTPDGARKEIRATVYFVAAAASVGVGGLIASQVTSDEWILAYVLYGLIGLFWIALPSVAAYGFSSDVPFPTLFRTIANLERRLRIVAVAILAGLVILGLHLAFYPWPDIADILQRKPPLPGDP